MITQFSNSEKIFEIYSVVTEFISYIHTNVFSSFSTSNVLVLIFLSIKTICSLNENEAGNIHKVQVHTTMSGIRVAKTFIETGMLVVISGTLQVALNVIVFNGVL